MVTFTPLRWATAGLAALLIAISSPAAAMASGPPLQIRDLGTLGGPTSESVAINDLGQIAGSSETADGTTHAFIWSHKRGMRDLGPGSAVDINNRGQVVGNDGFRMFIWDPRKGRRDLGALGGASAQASDLNDAGQIVGTMQVREGENVVAHAFRWDPRNGVRDLGLGIATVINASGQVAGLDSVGGGMGGFFWDPRTGRTPLSIEPGGDVTDFFLSVTGINNRGQVVGAAVQAFLWDKRTGGRFINTNESMTSDATDINERGDVVGRTQDSAADVDHAYLWTRKTGMVDLTNDENFAYAATSTGINNARQVIGQGTTSSGASGGEAFLWQKRFGLSYLGTLGGDASAAVDINEAGWIAGNASNASGDQHAVLWVAKRSHR